MEELKTWISLNGLDCQINGNLILVKKMGNFYFIEHKEGKILSDEFYLILDEDDETFIDEHEEDINFVVFKFGEDFYYSKLNPVKNQYNELALKPEFNDFLNIGNYEGNLGDEFEFVNLGIHTGYELLNGSGEPDEYIKKAVFFRQKYLGVCELNTLGSSLPFQMACLKKNIVPIIGEGISVAYNYTEGDLAETFELKIYAKNNAGWKTMLNISKIINVDYNKFIPIEKLLEFKTDDLICVIATDSYFNYNIYKKEESKVEYQNLKDIFGVDNLYYQIDLSEYLNPDYDADKLERIKKYIKSYSGKIKPVFIQDTYVVNQKDRELKSFLNKVSRKVSVTNNDCYMKSIDEVFDKYSELFRDSDEAFAVFISSIENTVNIANACKDFRIEIGKPKLPEYKMPKGVDKIEFYYDLIEEGLRAKILSKPSITDQEIDEYIERIQIENEVIIGADIVDYFLILWDVIEWCKKEGILVGIGRGSAGGSLVAYLMGITEINPIEYDLLFERFLNKTRTMPDIFYDVELEDGSKYSIPEEFYLKNIEGKKNVEPKDLKEFSV